jgi:tetratricopeptide (TPR) repeat protein
MLLLMLGCTAPSPIAAKPPSILIITVDTTRADRLGPYGYPSADTPTLDRLAEQGRVFDRAYSSCPLTIPSHSTIFTGRYPPSHGVRDNGDFILGPEQVTLAERLSEAGYATAAFTAAFPTQARWGFNQGFDVYQDPLERLPTQLDWRDQRTAGEVVDGALDTLPTLGDDQPLFVWVHVFDPHWPYAPPEPWRSEHLGNPYDGEIAYTDAQLARLFKWWDETQESSVVVVTADHGEGFGDGGERTHGFLLHDGTIRVPLILRAPGIEGGTRESDVVSHVDIVPTILDLVGLDLHPGLQGVDLRKGGSDQVYSEALTGQFNLGLHGLHSVSHDEGRFTEGGHGDFYPVVSNRVITIPDSTRDLEPEVARLRAMEASMDVVEAPTASLDEQAFEMLQALGYMGGDLSADAGDIDPRDVIDLIPLTWQARQLIGQRRYAEAGAVIQALEEGMPGTYGVDQLHATLLRARGDLPAASEAFTDLYLRSPSSTVALQLGGIYANIGAWPEAEGWYAEALALQPNSPEAMAGIVHAAQAQGEPERARELASEYLTVFPDHAELMLVLAELYLIDGRPEDALREAELAVKHGLHGAPWALSTLAQAQWETGQADPAIESLQEALSLNRYNLPIRVRLTECLLEVGRNAEAVRTIAPMARLLPDDPAIVELHNQAQAALETERIYR